MANTTCKSAYYEQLHQGKSTPTRIKNRNYFKVEKVKELMHLPEIFKYVDIADYAQNLQYRFENGEFEEG